MVYIYISDTYIRYNQGCNGVYTREYDVYCMYPERLIQTDYNRYVTNHFSKFEMLVDRVWCIYTVHIPNFNL